MIHFTRVQQSLCDLFTKVYRVSEKFFSNKDIYNFFTPYIYLLNKRFNSSNYWSSTTNASNTSNAWNVNFNNGNDNANNKTNTNFVRCVR